MNVSQWVVRNPNIMGGRPVFANSRVPVEVLFENLEDGLSLDEILQNYPTITKAAAIGVLEASKVEVVAAAPAAAPKPAPRVGA